jgi:CHAT domain-containing protein
MIKKKLFLLLVFMTLSYSNALKQRDIFDEKGISSYRDNKYTLAIEYFKKALEIEENILGKNHIDTANTTSNIAVCYRNLYQDIDALKYYKKYLKIKEKSLDKNSIELAILYNNMADVYKSVGDYKKALTLNKKSLKIKLYKYPNKKESISISYNNIAELYRHTGKYEKAFDYYIKSLKLREEFLGQNHKLTADSYSNIAGIYHAVGDYQKSIKYHKKSLKIRNKIKDKLADSYNNIAKTYQKMQEYNKSLESYHKSLEFNLAKRDKDYIFIAETYNNIAQTNQENNNLKEALKYANKSLNLNIKYIGDSHLQTSIIYATLATIYQKSDDYNKALEYDKKAIKIRKKFFGDKSIKIAQNYYSLSKSYELLQDYPNSIKYNKKAFDIFALNKKNHYLILGWQQKKDYNKHHNSISILSNLFKTSYLYAKTIKDNRNLKFGTGALAPAFGEAKAITSNKFIKEENFERWINYKGSISNKENTISILYKKIKELKSNIESLKINREYLSTLYQTYPIKSDIKRIENLDKEIKTTKDKILKAEINLNKTDKIFRELLKLQEININDISSNLKSNQIYIDFVRGENHYYIFTLDNDKNISFEMISSKETLQIDNEIKKFRDINQQMAKENRDIKQLTKDSKKSLGSIYKILNKYLFTEFKTKDYLIISPDGLLNFLPFEALYIKGISKNLSEVMALASLKGGAKAPLPNLAKDRYLIEDKIITYVPSAKELVRGFYQKHSKSNKTSKVVVFAYPDYNIENYEIKEKESNQTTRAIGVGNRLIDFQGSFLDLNGSLQEIKVIKKLFKNTNIYRDKNATVINLLNIKDAKILHISTHGFFLKNSSINYMQQSGLALAGANHARFSSDTSGLVTALKLSSMELSETALVVLSACETALGKIENSEGVAGLPKAFIQAGAKNIMMSLWSVDDKQTANLMEKFYKNVNISQDKESYIDSLRNAKLKMIDMHPYYWSSFIMSGV